VAYYIVNSTTIDFENHYKRFHDDLGPRHVLFELAKRLKGEVIQPNSAKPNILHRFLSLLISEPGHWAIAALIAKKCSINDTVYCAGEDTAIPLAICLIMSGKKTKLGSFIMDPENIRVKFFVKVFKLNRVLSLLTVTDEFKRERVIRIYGLNKDKIHVLPEQTDQIFFHPGKVKINNKKFLIASAGMEQRDYKTLADAVSDLDLKVKICAYSPNLSSKTKCSFPVETPDNIEIRHFEFPELRELYRSADVVVICLLENRYSAGLTVMMEAIACKTPVIITNNIGLGREFIEKNLVIGIYPYDTKDLRNKILQIINSPVFSKGYAERAYKYFIENHTFEAYLDTLIKNLENIPDTISL
jgi:glycosyltransferase involved in cell wall biosynthesis